MSVSQERTHRMEGFPPKEQREELGGGRQMEGKQKHELQFPFMPPAFY